MKQQRSLERTGVRAFQRTPPVHCAQHQGPSRSRPAPKDEMHGPPPPHRTVVQLGEWPDTERKGQPCVRTPGPFSAFHSAGAAGLLFLQLGSTPLTAGLSLPSTPGHRRTCGRGPAHRSRDSCRLWERDSRGPDGERTPRAHPRHRLSDRRQGKVQTAASARTEAAHPCPVTRRGLAGGRVPVATGVSTLLLAQPPDPL